MQPTHILDEQNQLLLDRLHSGDESAKAEITELNRDWAIKLALSLAPNAADRAAVEDAALRGIEAAADTSMHSGKHFAPFETATDGFATWYVRLAVLRYTKSVDGQTTNDEEDASP